MVLLQLVSIRDTNCTTKNPKYFYSGFYNLSIKWCRRWDL